MSRTTYLIFEEGKIMSEDIRKYVNKIKSKYHDNYIYDYNFIVNIGMHMFGFSKISNLTINSESHSVKEGGWEPKVLKNSNKTEVLKLEKGMSKNILNFEHWYKNGQLIRELTIYVMGAKKIPVMAFFFEEGMITKRSFSNLDAEGGKILIVEMEITHTGLEEMSI